MPEDVDPQVTDPQAVEEKADAEIREQATPAPDSAAEARISGVSEDHVLGDVADQTADRPGGAAEHDEAATSAGNPDQEASGVASPAASAEIRDEVKPQQHWAQLARLTTEDGSWFVERTWPTMQTDAGKIPVRPFVGPAVYVRCQYGLTLNLGRYESARIDVSLSVPCYPAEVQETYDFVSKWVSERVLQERAEIDAYRQQPPTGESNVSQG